MGGRWVYQKKNDHVCRKPIETTGVQVGDIWACECGIHWRVKHKDNNQRDPYLAWEQYTGEVPAQKRGGVEHPSEGWRNGSWGGDR